MYHNDDEQDFYHFLKVESRKIMMLNAPQALKPIYKMEGFSHPLLLHSGSIELNDTSNPLYSDND
jgi:hypothetical protein